MVRKKVASRVRPKKSTESSSSTSEGSSYSAFIAPRSAVQDAIKKSFSARLHRILLERGMRQSDLARAAELPRDSICSYVNGRALPSRLSAEKLAKALGMAVEELLPEITAPPTVEANSAALFEIKTLMDEPGKARLRINKIVRLSDALKIAELIESNKDASSDGK